MIEKIEIFQILWYLPTSFPTPRAFAALHRFPVTISHRESLIKAEAAGAAAVARARAAASRAYVSNTDTDSAN